MLEPDYRLPVQMLVRRFYVESESKFAFLLSQALIERELHYDSSLWVLNRYEGIRGAQDVSGECLVARRSLNSHFDSLATCHTQQTRYTS